MTVRLSLQSFNYRDRFIRHKDFVGELDPVSPGYSQDALDATFDIVPGLEDKNLISFQAVNANLTDHFLRHQNYIIKLNSPSPGDATFNADATFIIVPGLVNGTPVEGEDSFDFFSFRSLNKPDLYIRHRNWHLYLEDGSQDPPGPGPFVEYTFEKDASFRLVRALYIPHIT